jgi:hypothetical protein
MTTLAFRIKSTLNRLGTGKKKNADWARIEEPESLLRGIFLSALVIVLNGLFATLAANLLSSPDDAMMRFATWLKIYGNDFNTAYASFSIALLSLINMLLLVIFLVFGHSDEDDVVEMISDLDAAINERLAEVEHTINERLDDIHIQLGDMLNGNGDNTSDMDDKS